MRLELANLDAVDLRNFNLVSPNFQALRVREQGKSFSSPDVLSHLVEFLDKQLVKKIVVLLLRLDVLLRGCALDVSRHKPFLNILLGGPLLLQIVNDLCLPDTVVKEEPLDL